MTLLNFNAMELIQVCNYGSHDMYIYFLTMEVMIY